MDFAIGILWALICQSPNGGPASVNMKVVHVSGKKGNDLGRGVRMDGNEEIGWLGWWLGWLGWVGTAVVVMVVVGGGGGSLFK